MSELLAMLAAGSPPLQQVSKGTQTITPSDVAAALAHCDRFTYLYGLAKFALDENVKAELNTYAIQLAKKENFDLHKTESEFTPHILGLVALQISIKNPRCNKCKGTGHIPSKNTMIVCPSCIGVGEKDISIRKLAKLLSVSQWRSRKIWKPRLAKLLMQYSVLESDINEILKIGLRG